MKAVIMAGGFGTRLRPLTMTLPKPMVSVLNVPMMEHIVNLLKKYDIDKVVSLLYYQSEIITSYFEDGSKFEIDMDYVLAEADYSTAGAVKNANDYLDETFIVISGDVLTDFDLSKAIKFHKEKKSKATILLTRVPKPLQYGIVMTDDDGKITRFLEKPSWGQVFTDTINTGIYILEPEVLDLVPYQEEFDFSKDLFPLMLEKKMALYGCIVEGYWKDVGNLNEYQKGQKDALSGKLKLEKKGSKKGNAYIGEGSNVAPNVKLKGNVVIGKNANISEHAEITDSVIGDNVNIGMGAKITETTIWENTIVGDFAELTDDVVCNDCRIDSYAIVSENVFISEGCVIRAHAKLSPNIKLWPNKEIEEGATLSNSLVQEEKWHRELFTDARITGLSNIEIHPEFGAKLGAAIGMAYGKNITLIVSRDTDRVSRIMKRAITASLSSIGVNINDLQEISIPQTRQELRTNKYAGGFHVRRSPRNPNRTDIIIFSPEGRDIQISKAKSIERFFFGEYIKRAHQDEVGELYYPERTNEIYMNRFLESLEVDSIKQAKFKLLIDYSYGLASTILPFLLGKMDIEALSLHDYVDSRKFQPNATTENTAEAEKIMRSLGYSMGFIIEPGAEKISLLDDRGVFYNPTRLLSIVAKLFLETNKDKEPYKIAVSIMASSEVEEIAKDYDVEVYRIKDTHSAMMEATREDKTIFVGGVWGNFIFSDFLFAADGMYSIGKILEMLSVTGYRISELDESLPIRYQYHKTLKCPWDRKGTVMRKAMEFSENKERLLVDGVKIFTDGDSALVLPDKEKGSFLVMGESDKPEKAVEITKKYGALVQQWIDEN